MRTFFDELRRRNVFRVAAAYLVVAWLLIQVGDAVLPAFEAPDWALKTFIALIVAAFPVALVFAWAFEMTPEGVKRTEAVPREDSIAHGSGKKIDYAIVGALVLVALLIGADRLMPERGASMPGTAESVPGTTAASGDPSAGPQGASTMPPQRREFAVPPGKSVAVLPFLAMSSGPDDGYFADGLTEEIINRLTTLPELLVTARTSAFHFKGARVPVPEIAATLGVAHVVEGSVRRSAGQVRITAQLIRAEDGFHLWSKAYDRPLDDIFAVQTDIAEHIADALGVLLDERQRATMAEVGVRDIEAFLAFQRGQAHYQAAHDEGVQVPSLLHANAEFDTALDRKRDFAQAWFMHSDLYVHILMDELPGQSPDAVSMSGLSMDEAMSRFVDDLTAAYRFEADPGQRLVIRAVRKFLSSDWRGLSTDLDRAFASWENCRAGTWINTMGVAFGRAVDVYRKGLALTRCDPLNLLPWGNAATGAIVLGQPDEALRLVDEAESLVGPHFAITITRLQALFALKRYEEAERILAEGIVSDPFVRVQVIAAAGRKADAAAMLAKFGSGYLTAKLVANAIIGEREAANRVAASIDATPLGAAMLAEACHICLCGAPFDLDATPNFARQLKEGNLPWPPPSPIDYPLKDW